MIRYTRREEQWNTWSHAAGVAMGMLVAVVFLRYVYQGHDPWARIGVSLYLFGMLAYTVGLTD